MSKRPFPALLLCLVLTIAVFAGDTDNPGVEEPAPTPTPSEMTMQSAPNTDPVALLLLSVISVYLKR